MRWDDELWEQLETWWEETRDVFPPRFHTTLAPILNILETWDGTDEEYRDMLADFLDTLPDTSQEVTP